MLKQRENFKVNKKSISIIKLRLNCVYEWCGLCEKGEQNLYNIDGWIQNQNCFYIHEIHHFLITGKN